MAKKEKGKGNKGWRARVSSAAGTTLFAPPGFKDSYKEWFRDLVKVVMWAGATPAQAEDAAAKALEEMYRDWDDRQYTITYARTAAIHNFFKDKTRGTGRVSPAAPGPWPCPASGGR